MSTLSIERQFKIFDFVKFCRRRDVDPPLVIDLEFFFVKIEKLVPKLGRLVGFRRNKRRLGRTGAIFLKKGPLFFERHFRRQEGIEFGRRH